MHFTLVGKLCCIWRCERSGSSRSQSKVIQGSNDGTLLFNFEHFLMPSFHYQQSLWPLSSGLPSCCWCFPHQFYGTSCLKIGSCISSYGDQNPKNASYLQCRCTLAQPHADPDTIKKILARQVCYSLLVLPLLELELLTRSWIQITGDFSCSMGNNSENSPNQWAEEELWIGTWQGIMFDWKPWDMH